ncbi:MAG: YdcF family protein [Lachnospiraceae bacterium]|nr:YdcF family protein [Lachnospiraceae bacterium]
MISLMIITITAICCLLYYSTIISYAGTGTAFAEAWLIAGCALIIVAIVLMADRKFDFLKYIPKWVLISVASVVAAGGLLFMVLFGCVLSKMNSCPEHKADYVIVLGAQIRGENITRSLKYRLEAAYEYYRENPDCVIVVSGGQGEGENISEALAMQRYLVEKGVPEDKIIMENKSTSTNENLRFSYEIIKSRGDENVNIVICSNDFHIFRALKLAEKIGIKNPEGLASKSDEILHFSYMVRDSLAIFKEVLLGNI